MSAEPTEVFAAVTEILAEEAGIDAATITRDTDLAKDLDIDSLGLLTIATQIEERFPITLEDSLLTKLTTVGQLVDQVCDAQA
ncbi:Meromycolate extension acyl carrier protein [Actinomyces bovis]|uniref:Acyl carrier protein n=1 Tax=Actinomyces bovis TaxID=1658 RepID=A0ABY1VQ57_9ACTO|nr:acyl carrier protein [Actinomyces bovis]SPT54140.1 Meromycolate extension acyl carrier protein [Actinomyces bovis]VEG53612.1 Meromycolate extension acyl carrier protein [Actinomyces israelii]